MDCQSFGGCNFRSAPMATARFKKSLIAAVIAASSLCTGAWRAEADTFVQTNLVSNIPGLATLTDPNLINPWGVSHLPTSPFWVSDQVTNVSTLYNVTGSTTITANPLVVTIPTTASGPPQGPTGQVSNTNTSSFLVNGGAAANFIFANLNGTISARNAGNAAFIQATTPGAVYTGLAINQAGTQLYAANGAQNRIDVFNSSFSSVSLGPTAFATPASIPTTFVPFNVQTLNGEVYVTYAPAGRPNQQSATPGMGAVAVFNESGVLLRTMTAAQIMAAGLAAPWGITLAPAGFGPFGGDLLVGNFSFAHSSITALDPITLAALGSIMINAGSGNTPGGLWFIGFGQGGNNGSPNTLYFTDGINGEKDGLFGAINPVPLPGALPLFATGLGALGLLGWRKRRKAHAAA